MKSKFSNIHLLINLSLTFNFKSFITPTWLESKLHNKKCSESWLPERFFDVINFRAFQQHFGQSKHTAEGYENFFKLAAALRESRAVYKWWGHGMICWSLDRQRSQKWKKKSWYRSILILQYSGKDICMVWLQIKFNYMISFWGSLVEIYERIG